MELLFDVKHQVITRKDKRQVVAVSQNYIEMLFTFTPDWNGLQKIMYVKHKGAEYTVELVNNRAKIDIPSDGVMRFSVRGSEAAADEPDRGSRVIVSAVYGDVIAIVGSGFKNAEARYVRSLNISQIEVIKGVPCYEYGGAWLPLAGTAVDVPDENTGKILIGDQVKSITEENYSTAEKNKLAALPDSGVISGALDDVETLWGKLTDTDAALGVETLRNDAQDAAISEIEASEANQDTRIAVIESACSNHDVKISELQSSQALRDEKLDDIGEALDRHIIDKNNPHGVTAGQIGALTQADILPGNNISIVPNGNRLTIHSTASGGGGYGAIKFQVNIETGYLELLEAVPGGGTWSISENGVLEAVV